MSLPLACSFAFTWRLFCLTETERRVKSAIISHQGNPSFLLTVYGNGADGKDDRVSHLFADTWRVYQMVWGYDCGGSRRLTVRSEAVCYGLLCFWHTNDNWQCSVKSAHNLPFPFGLLPTVPWGIYQKSTPSITLPFYVLHQLLHLWLLTWLGEGGTGGPLDRCAM